MSSVQGGYPQQAYQVADQDGQQDGQQHEQGVQQPGFDTINIAAAHQGGRKKRAYAGQAFEFGTGANAGVAAQPHPPYSTTQGAQYGGLSQQQQPLAYQQPTYGDQGAPQQIGASGYGQPQYGAAAGYQPAAPSYPAQGVPQAGVVGGLTQQFGQMGIAGQAQPPLQGQAQQLRLNQLYSTDLISQPFTVAELDLPPPPIILPPNVSHRRYEPGLD